MLTPTHVLALIGFVVLPNLPGGGVGRADLFAAEAPVIKTAPDIATTARDAIAANRDFAVDLYQQLAREHQGKNLFFSPYSVSGALAMTVEGARGETADQMGKVLRFPDAARQVGSNAEMVPWNTALIHSGMSSLNQRFSPHPIPQKLREQIAALRKNLDTANRQATEFQKAGNLRGALQASDKAEKVAAELNALLAQVDQYEICVANALWGEKTYPFQPAFLGTIRKFYGTGAAFPVDFKAHAEAARQQINAWVENQTNKRIRDLIPSGGVDGATRLVLTNAVYFKGEWPTPFAEDLTKQDDFTVAGGTKVRVPMMHEGHKPDVQYAAFNADGTIFKTPAEVPARREPDPKTVYPGKSGFVMLELPYKGGDLSMVVIVPQDAGGLEELEKKLTGDDLQKWIGKLQHRVVNVFLPKFNLETEYTLKPTLVAMGMSRAFDNPALPNGAQFEGMSASQDPEEQLYISDVRHKAFVEVSEKGTEAAAATVFGFAPADEPLPATVPFTPTFRADKPFLFLIRDIKSGTVLFLGRMVRPQ